MKISLTACVVNSRGKYPAPDKKEKRKGTGLLRETRLCRLRGLRRQPEEGPRGTENSQAGARLRSARRDAPWPLAHRRKCRRSEGAGVHTGASPEAGRKDTGRGTAERRTVREAGGLVFIRQAQGRRKGSLSIRGNSCGLPSVARRQDRPNLKKLAAPGG